MKKVTNTLDVPITTEKDDLHREGLRYTHPSYGMVSVSRRNSARGVRFFGAEVESNSIISLTISKAQNTQSLGQNWFFSKDVLAEVEMTPVQYAEMISNPNSQGTPCTIRYTEKDGYITYKPHSTQVEYTESELRRVSDGLSEKLAKQKAKVREILTAKGTLKKADKEALLSLMNSMGNDITSSIPFYQECMKENIEQMKMEAKVEVESFVANALNRVGLKALENPETVKLILTDSTKED